MRISTFAARCAPYVCGEQPQGGGWIKLNTNECPYPCTDGELPDRAELRLYPDPCAKELTRAIADHHGVREENVFVGNGSDEVLAFAFRALFDSDGAPLLAPELTYSFYPVFASLWGIPYRTVPLNGDFTVDAEALLDRKDSCGIVLANPNAPTSLALGEDALLRIVESNADRPVIVDEAYVDFGGQSLVGAIDSHPNLLVTRTLSKSYSLAGLRVGYAVGSPVLIDALERVKNCFNSYPIDRYAQVIATQAIRRSDVMRQNVARVVATRERVTVALRESGFCVLPSATNFIFCKHGQLGGAVLFDALREKRILVRRWDTPLIRDWLRISIGTDEEMDSLLSALSDAVRKDR